MANPRVLLVPQDYKQNEIRNARVQNLASAPGSPVEGQIYHNTTTHDVQIYDGSSWYSTKAAAITYGTPGASAVGDTAAQGVATTLARSDHTHAREGFGAVVANTTFGLSAANGTATTVARSDHSHGSPTAPTAASVGAVANNGGAPYLQTGTAGTRPASGLTVGGLYVDNDDFLGYIATSTTTYSQLAPFAAVGAVTSNTPGNAAAAGTATTYARGDHQHATPAWGTSTTASAPGDATSQGSSATFARSDHTHGRTDNYGAVGTMVAETFGAAASAGTSANVARIDHVHAMPAAPTTASIGAVANNGGAPGLQTGTAAGRPTSGQTTGNIYADNDDGLLFIATGATTFTQLAPFGAVGAITTSAVADAAAAGTATTYARADHRHGREAFGAVTAVTVFGGIAGNGSATTLSRSDHSHGSPIHDGTVHNFTLSYLTAPIADFAWGSHKITGLLDPTNPQDAATKNYVDNAVAGLAWKDAVNVATTAALAANTYANGAAGVGATLTANANAAFPTMDGYTPALNDRVLVKNEATAANNGIYVLTQVGSGAAPWILTRATDADAPTELQGAAVYVMNGTANGGLAWTMNQTAAITVGTTALTWTIQSGANVVTAGAGLTASGNVYAVGAGTGIVVAADTVSVDTAVVARKYTQLVGTGAATSIVVNHALGNQWVNCQVFNASSPFDEQECEIDLTDANNVTLGFTTAPASNALRVVITG